MSEEQSCWSLPASTPDFWARVGKVAARAAELGGGYTAEMQAARELEPAFLVSPAELRRQVLG